MRSTARGPDSSTTSGFSHVSKASGMWWGGALLKPQHCYSFPLPLLLLLCNLFRIVPPSLLQLKGLQGAGCLCRAASVLGRHQQASAGAWQGAHQGGASKQSPGSCELPPCPTPGLPWALFPGGPRLSDPRPPRIPSPTCPGIFMRGPWVLCTICMAYALGEVICSGC